MSADRTWAGGPRARRRAAASTAGRALAVPLLVAATLAPAAAAGAAQATPSLTATLTGGQVVGEPLTEVVTLSGGVAPTGFLSFRAYGPADPACVAQPAVWTSLDVVDNGQYTFQSAPTETGVHRYVVSYEGDVGNAPASTACGDPSQTVTVARTQPVLATTASLAGGAIVDAARLTHVAAPTGTVTFALHGPDDACTQPPLATSTVPVTAVGYDDGRATSAPYDASVPGTYRWIASYSGDERNLPVAGACGDPSESVTVAAPASPASLRLRGPSRGTVGEQVRTTATLTTPGFATGRLTFRVYRPGDDRCRRGAVAASTRDVFGNGEYGSDPFTPDEPGTYRVVASFEGADGSTLTTSCDDPTAVVSVAPAARPRPVLERTVTLERVDGTVLVDVAGAATRADAHASAIGFVEVRRPRAIPVGSTVDARAGTARVTSATRRVRLQSGTFRGSRFVVRQRAAGRGLVELQLRPRATARAMCAADDSAARASKRKRLGKGVVAKLRAKVRGRFETHGEHSSASAHGTDWLTIERCDGTLTRVVSGVVAVHDFAQRRTLLLRAGESHLAQP